MMRARMIANGIRLAALVCSCLLAAEAVADRQPSMQQVKAGVALAKKSFQRINTDPGAAASYAALCEMGGSPLAYLSASIESSADLPAFTDRKPCEPFSVFVGFDERRNCFIIEGYADNPAQPAVKEIVEYRGPAAAGRSAGSPAAAAVQPPDKNFALMQACEAGDLAAAQALIAQGANVNARSNESGTPLMYACAKGHAAVARALIAAGADPKARADDQNGWTVLMYAAHNGAPDVMGLLIEKGAEPNAADKSGNTPLMLAALRGNEQAAALLLQAGADVNAQESKQRNSPLLLAASRGHEHVAAVLIKGGANVNQSDASGMTPLMACAEKGHTGIACDLIQAKADLEARLTGKIGGGATALMLAAAKGQAEMVRLLLDKGANTAAADNNGATAGRYAAHNGHTDLAEIIRDAGTSVPTAPASAPASGPATAAPAPAGPEAKALIGKNRAAADAAFGKPIGTLKQGDMTILMYRNAKVYLKNGVIANVRQ